MANASHTIRQELHGILLFVGGIWAVFLLTWFFPSLDHYGIVPRTLTVQSMPLTGVAITGTPAGTTNYSNELTYLSSVNLSAPAVLAKPYKKSSRSAGVAIITAKGTPPNTISTGVSSATARISTAPMAPTS